VVFSDGGNLHQTPVGERCWDRRVATNDRVDFQIFFDGVAIFFLGNEGGTFLPARCLNQWRPK
jgi:hypothetical protein